MRTDYFRRVWAIVREVFTTFAFAALTVICFVIVERYPFMPSFVAWFVLLISVAVISVQIYNLVDEFRYPCTAC